MDWARFAQMLLNGGELEGKRLLKPETVAYITSDLLGPLGNRSDTAYIPGQGYGVGFDFYVRVDTTGVDFPANIGEFCKDGIAGTVYWVDPKENLIAVFMVSTTTQRPVLSESNRKNDLPVYHRLVLRFQTGTS